MAGLIAGFDAGQTHTTCRLALAEPGLGGRIDSVVVAEGRGPGVSHLAASGGPQRFQAALIQSLGHARAILASGDWGDGSLPLRAAAIGASGIEQGSGVQTQGQALACSALNLPLERVVVTGDERTALVGAFADGAGIVVISGTGTIAVGRNANGQEHRCAGWGWLLDGGGSAMDIGQDGLRLSLQMADGRRPEGPLRAALWQGLGRPRGSRRLWWHRSSAPPVSPGWRRWWRPLPALAMPTPLPSCAATERSWPPWRRRWPQPWTWPHQRCAPWGGRWSTCRPSGQPSGRP